MKQGTRVLLCLLLSAPFAVHAQGVEVRTSIIVPVFDSFAIYGTGAGLGAEMFWPVPQSQWRINGGLDVDTLLTATDQYIFTVVHPGVSYGAFYGPTAFMSFGLDGGWVVVTRRDLNLHDNKPYVSASSAVTFYLGPHVSFRIALGWQEFWGLLHAASGSLGFEVD